MNQQQQQSIEGKQQQQQDDDSALSDFLASLMDYTPTIPDELVEHYVAKSGFQCPDVRLIRLVAVATQKFIAEVATDALQHCKARQTAVVKDKRDKQQKDKRLTLTMEDLSKALQEDLGDSLATVKTLKECVGRMFGVNMKHQEYFADSPSTGVDPVREE
ncbi:hypothetical protein IFM89_024516 [Coptis chinensis]|uniref:Transcription initiation factor TFIID subunit 10 n=1 Tax=Coptis chinensis TaxID=261450 RepID=A0A835HJN2_9MAGN|nr:hypothetical protein IFM89_024516 [Coptis chinensis]